jgi:Histidine kinase-, DNA gyrase B-, and HSP90-like ATPase
MIVESSDTELEKGTGLGLAIVARIVRNMNGQLRAESEEGCGSRFTFAFTFPIPTSAQETAFLEAAIATPQPDSQLTYAAPMSPERPPISPRRMSNPRRPSSTRRSSNDSMRSQNSTNSGKSHIDQLVDMIARPSLDDVPRSSGIVTNVKRRGSATSERGEYNVQDSGTPIRGVKVDEEDMDVPAAKQAANHSLLAPQKNLLKPPLNLKKKRLNVLVAEDDPVNRAILKKRLEMDGHLVTLTKDGGEAVEAFANCWKACDIILMDLQVRPIRLVT